jgi:hypothetical protein
MRETTDRGLLTLAEILGPVEQRILEHRQGGGRRHRVPVPAHRRPRTRSWEQVSDRANA